MFETTNQIIKGSTWSTTAENGGRFRRQMQSGDKEAQPGEFAAMIS